MMSESQLTISNTILADLTELASIELVNAGKHNISNEALPIDLSRASIQEAGKYICRLVRLRRFLQRHLAVTKANLDYAEMMLGEKLRNSGLSNANVAGVGTFKIKRTILARIIESQKETAHNWLRSQGMGEIIKLTVNSASLRAKLRRHFEIGGEAPPSDAFDVSFKERAQLEPNRIN